MAIMNQRKAIILTSLFALVTILIFIIVNFTTTDLGSMEPGSGLTQEKISIQSVSYNCSQNCLTVYMESTSIEVTLNNAIIKDCSDGNVVTNTTISDTLSDNHIQKTTVDLNMTLPSGNYTLTLISTKHSIFVSPRFNISY
jgi:hypothetical protein